MKSQLLFFFSALGVFNGLLASFYLLFLNKKKRTPNYFLGFLILMLSIRIGKSVYLIFNENEVRFYLQIGLSACFMIGVMLYYYLKASLSDIKIIPLNWKIHIAVLLVFIIGIGIVKPYKTNPIFWGDFFIDFIYIFWGIYILFSGVLIQHIFKKYFKNKKSCSVSEQWILVVFMANAMIYLGYIVGRFQLYIVGTLTFSIAVYVLIFFLLYKKNREGIFEDIPEKYGAKKIDASKAQLLIEGVKKLLEEQEMYKNPNIKLKDVASQLETTSHQLSQLLNDNLQKSFTELMNEYRVEEAKKLLKINTQYTLEAIGFEAGFSSKSSFYASFKKVVGLTPSQYKKQ